MMSCDERKHGRRVPGRRVDSGQSRDTDVTPIAPDSRLHSDRHEAEDPGRLEYELAPVDHRDRHVDRHADRSVT